MQNWLPRALRAAVGDLQDGTPCPGPSEQPSGTCRMAPPALGPAVGTAGEITHVCLCVSLCVGFQVLACMVACAVTFPCPYAHSHVCAHVPVSVQGARRWALGLGMEWLGWGMVQQEVGRCSHMPSKAQDRTPASCTRGGSLGRGGAETAGGGRQGAVGGSTAGWNNARTVHHFLSHPGP